MPQQTTTMAAPARAAQARVDWIDHWRDLDDFTPALSGWRVGLAVAVVATMLVLLALPVLAVLDPPLASHAAGWLGRLAAVVPLMTAVRALVFVVAAVIISRPDARQ
jgi:hypothetical protein